MREPRQHRVRGRHGIVNHQSQRDDERAKRDALHVDVRHLHDGEDNDERERNGGSNHQAGTETEADETGDEDDPDGLPQRGHELGNGAVDRCRLVGDQSRFYAQRQISCGFSDGGLDVPAQSQNVAAVPHGDGKPDGGLAIDAKEWLGRISKTAPDARNVAEAQHASADGEIDVRNVFFGAEGARHAQREGFVAGLYRAGGLHDVLCLQCSDQSRAVNAEARKFFHREFDKDLFVLRTQNFDLGDVAHVQQFRTHILDIVAKLAVGKSVRGETVDNSECVTKFIVEARSDNARGEGVTHVADAFAHVIPDVGNLPGARAVLEIDEDRGDASAREAAQEIEVRRFLQRALEPLGDLLEHVIDTCAGPCGLHHHRLDDERGIFVAAKLHEGKETGDDGHDHQIDRE